MVLGNFIVEVVISFGPKDPSVTTDRVEVALLDADPGESPKVIQSKLSGITRNMIKRNTEYWNQFGNVFPAFTIRRR